MIAAAKGNAAGTGRPHWTISWPVGIWQLTPDNYILVVSVEDETGTMHEVARQPAFTITP